MNYFTTDEISKTCYVVPRFRTNFDQKFLHTYNPIALNTVTVPPLNNPKLMDDFYGTPTSLNLLHINKNINTTLSEDPGEKCTDNYQTCCGVTWNGEAVMCPDGYVINPSNIDGRPQTTNWQTAGIDGKPCCKKQ